MSNERGDIVESEVRKEIMRFLTNDGLDMSETGFKYLLCAIENYSPGQSIREMAKPISEKYQIREDNFKKTCGKLIKKSISMPEATLRKYVAFVYARVIIK